MNDRHVILFRAASSAEAHVVRGRLEAEGIDVFVSDDVAVGTLSYIGSALGGVKVNVRERDFERARDVLVSIQAETGSDTANEAPHAAPKSSWICASCGERVPWEFDVCWSCGTPAPAEKVPVADEEGDEPVLGPPPLEGNEGNVSSGQPASDFRDDASAMQSGLHGRRAATNCSACGVERPEKADCCPTCGAAPDGPVNPYRYTGVGEEDVVAEPSLPAATKDIEQVVARAFRASVIGVMLCPPIICTYAMCLLLFVALQNVQLTKSGNRKFYAALLINVLIGCPLSLVFLLFVFGPMLLP
jgi:hypothetical protein